MSNPGELSPQRNRSSLSTLWSALALCCVAFAATSVIQSSPALARSAAGGPDAGEEPPAGPIVYNLAPEQGALISAEDLGDLRVGATIETQHEGGLRSAKIAIDDQEMPNPSLGGAYSYLQSVSSGMGDLGPGEHTVEVTAVDSEGRTGGHEWTFTVTPETSEKTESPVEEAESRSESEQGSGTAEETESRNTQSPPPTAQIRELPDTGGSPIWPTGVGAALLIAGCSVLLGSLARAR